MTTDDPPTPPVGWDAAFAAVRVARRHLGEQQAQERGVNKRRDQIGRRLLDIEMAIAWLICKAKDEAREATHE